MKAVILAGGEGSGLFPLSRKNKPKQFHAFTNSQTFLKRSYTHVKKIFAPKDIYIVTNAAYASLVKEQLPNFPDRHLLLEPRPRNTAAAIGLATVYLERQTSRQIMAVFYTNHVVEHEKALHKALDIAEKIVKLDNRLVLIEVNPTFPSDKLGYVKIGRALREIEGQIVFEFKEFVEKPTLAQAKKFLESWEYLWNTGFLVVRTDKLLSLYKRYLPKLYKSLLKIKRVLGSPSEGEVKTEVYGQLENISFDYGLMEKIEPVNVAVIPADLGWTDVRTWPILYELLRKDRTGNAINALSAALETRGCLIFGDKKKLIVSSHVKDLLIVDTEDVMFVGGLRESEKMRQIVKKLEKRGRKKYL